MSHGPNLPLCVADPEVIADACARTRSAALMASCHNDTVCTPMAEQQYLLGLAALQAAEAHFRLADYLNSRKD